MTGKLSDGSAQEVIQGGGGNAETAEGSGWGKILNSFPFCTPLGPTRSVRGYVRIPCQRSQPHEKPQEGQGEKESKADHHGVLPSAALVSILTRSLVREHGRPISKVTHVVLQNH